MEGFEVSSAHPRLGLDEDVEMTPFAHGSEELQLPDILHGVSGHIASSSTAEHNPAAQYLAITANSSENQVVLHQSRRRRASGELIPDLRKASSSSSTSGGWRPVRLQGYSEDPMKEEVIRGQTETIRELQSQIKNLQEEHVSASSADQRAREATVALQREQLKVAQQEELLNQLLSEVKNLREDLRQKNEGKGKENIRQRTKSSEGPEEAEVARNLSSYYMIEDSPMLLEQDRREVTDVGNEPNATVPNQARNTSSGDGEHLPRSASVPLPLSFKRTGGRRLQTRKIPNTPSSVRPTSPPIWANVSTSASPVPVPQMSPVSNLEAKVDLIINKLGIGNGSSSLSPQQRWRRPPAREFRSPRPKTYKEDGRNERLAWVRSQLHGLLGIKQDRDILNTRDSLYVENIQLARRMAQFEQDARSPGPATLKPMQVNWATIRCRWNESLLALFLIHCQENGYGNGQLTEEDEDEIGELFFKRLERIQGIINEYRPKPNESIEQADKRYSDRHLIKLSVARRNRRRGELFNTRCDINLDHLPDDLEDNIQSDEETKRWIDRYRINEAFGIEGTSSDGTDPYDSDAYYVHTLPWRNRDLAKKMRTTDAARRATNEYGNNRPGNRPRTRKRHSGPESKASARKVPSDLPINCYDECWYNSLSAKKKRELNAQPALQLLATWESD